MKLVIGLGNPGTKYKSNRHNVGHMFVDWAKKESFAGYERFFIKKTDCFMNNSGEFVKKVTSDQQLVAPANNLFIVHDDLDIPLGQYKIQFGVGPKVHYGLNSIEQALGTKDFWRIRIGVDNRPKIQDTRLAVGQARYKIQGEEYVLQDFPPEELKVIEHLFAKIWGSLSKQFLS